ncbi:hypothetical protein EJ02DRAFT_491204 [Clathrospora elynae]|uniref:Uncharacterized protein n=1 Tax=Clathrospora elynae TaxID=706981 RepID=A0A6A5SMB6_9PLEO|nr:hypothetical protein EJ02DRAFT_491204 [Clathrospora elynae]
MQLAIPDQMEAEQLYQAERKKEKDNNAKKNAQKAAKTPVKQQSLTQLNLNAATNVKQPSALPTSKTDLNKTLIENISIQMAANSLRLHLEVRKADASTINAKVTKKKRHSIEDSTVGKINRQHHDNMVYTEPPKANVAFY